MALLSATCRSNTVEVGVSAGLLEGRTGNRAPNQGTVRISIGGPSESGHTSLPSCPQVRVRTYQRVLCQSCWQPWLYVTCGCQLARLFREEASSSPAFSRDMQRNRWSSRQPIRVPRPWQNARSLRQSECSRSLPSPTLCFVLANIGPEKLHIAKPALLFSNSLLLYIKRTAALRALLLLHQRFQTRRLEIWDISSACWCLRRLDVGV